MIHDSPIGGHLGLEKTMDKLTRVFYWKNMQDDVIRYLQSCQACQMVKPMNQSKFGLLQPLPIPEQPWEQVSMDFITGLPPTTKGNDSILVFVDRLTKMVRVAATTTNCDSRTTANLFMEHVFRSYGIPKTIVSDRDIRFVSAFWSDLLKCLGSRSLMSTAFHPQTDGQTERANRTLEDMLRCFCSDYMDRWDTLLIPLEFAYNDSKHAGTKETPFFLNYGRHPNLPLSLAIGAEQPCLHKNSTIYVEDMKNALEVARSRLEIAQQRQMLYANKSRREHDFKVGDQVLLATHPIKFEGTILKKLGPRYFGPFEIIRFIPKNAVELNTASYGHKFFPVVHVDRLKKYYPTLDIPTLEEELLLKK